MDKTYRLQNISILFFVLFISTSFGSPTFASSLVLSQPEVKLEALTGVYFPPARLYGRSFEGIVHYMKAAGLNLAVLHAKDPLGQLFWKSNNRTAKTIEASAPHASLENAISILKQRGIWTAAKLDVFQDSLLVSHFPEMGVRDSETGELWADHKGLHWANPYDTRVWDYTIALCQELITLGVDEIQFDYVRFPSDGDMSTIEYPIVTEGTSKAECIGKFLAFANTRLKPTGVVISADLFGMIAWKTKDFGVGQVLEQVAPHVDVICPMFYPSHFPENFLNLKNPGQYPHKIMKSSLEEIKKRTSKEIRPWIQGFWYTPEEIDAQLQGVTENEVQTWTVWNPSGRYAETFDALAARTGKSFPAPEFYPPLEDLKDKDDLIQLGQTIIINHTCYREGYSILSLDDSVIDGKQKSSTISGVASTLDESIIDRILTARDLDFNLWTSRRTKILQVTNLIIQDLQIDPKRLSPFPIYVDWGGDCAFTRSIPPDKLELYLSHNLE
ncbi:MAG: hypothetical protein JSV17_00070 [Candidatus Aminicenantes bacterium]|nr:MAG: hypothetical protein JSV17_00070 [Candidatus Aminicenantes bacterium]